MELYRSYDNPNTNKITQLMKFIYFCDEWNGEENTIKRSNTHTSGVDGGIKDAYSGEEQEEVYAKIKTQK